jgi:hypothetical protein
MKVYIDAARKLWNEGINCFAAFANDETELHKGNRRQGLILVQYLPSAGSSH